MLIVLGGALRSCQALLWEELARLKKQEAKKSAREAKKEKNTVKRRGRLLRGAVSDLGI